MDWKKKCYAALYAAWMFEDLDHANRFKEMVDCFSGYPFFTKGLCKCIYLSSWDNDHFCIMLETLTDLSLGRETTTEEMRIKGDILAEEQVDAEYYVYQLSNAFLDNKVFRLDPSVVLPESFQHIINRALKAAAIIDNL